MAAGIPIIEVGERIRCSHQTTVDNRNDDYHLHDVYEIYLFLRGDVRYFVEDTGYELKRGDLLIFNNYEIHRATFHGDAPYERAVIHFDPSMMAAFSTEHTDLMALFRNHFKGEGNLAHLEESEIVRFFDLFETLMDTLKDSSDTEEAVFGKDVLSRSYLAQLLVFLNRIFQKSSHAPKPAIFSGTVQQMVEYIDEHLTDPLSLEMLERKFLINRYSLCRQFKQETGITIYSHILNKRIAKAKKYLSEQKSVTEAGALAGFGDYSNFIRTFRKYTGFSPLQYRKQVQ